MNKAIRRPTDYFVVIALLRSPYWAGSRRLRDVLAVLAHSGTRPTSGSSAVIRLPGRDRV